MHTCNIHMFVLLDKQRIMLKRVGERGLGDSESLFHEFIFIFLQTAEFLPIGEILPPPPPN